MVIKILGSGCPKCNLLEKSAREAVEKSGIAAEIKKVTALSEIMNYGVMITPALVIDEVVKAAGKVLTVAEIETLLKG